MINAFLKDGFAIFDAEPSIADWAETASPVARAASRDPALQPEWSRCDGTWFVGVDTLPVDDQGRLGQGPALVGAGPSFCQNIMDKNWNGWGLGQGSICYPNYPAPCSRESMGAHRYRQKRDSAHLDGLKPIGPERRRHFDEFHGFIFGVPLSPLAKGAAPFVIWAGSHLIFQQMLWDTYAHLPFEEWEAVDLTDIYQKTRARIFETCPRVEIQADIGQCYIAHRFSLHGVAPWTNETGADHRSIAYFRPYWSGDMLDWLRV